MRVPAVFLQKRGTGALLCRHRILCEKETAIRLWENESDSLEKAKKGSRRAPGFCAPSMDCKARVASTLVPAEFTLAAVREKFNDRCLC